MGIGKIDPEYAVREGWARDSDDEVYMDGYNAFIQVSTHDGTSGFSVKNDLGAVSFSSKSDGDGYVAKNLGVGTYNPQTKLEVIGKTRTDQFQVTEDAVSGYVLTSDTDGNATWQEAGASTDVRVKVSSNDTTTDYLSEKVSAGTGILLTEQNDGGDEDLEISIAPGILDGYGEASLPEPTCCGQVLYALDTNSFTPELPLTSTTSGWLINNSGNLLVVG